MFALYTRRWAGDKAEWKTEDVDENYLCEVVAPEYINSLRYERVAVYEVHHNKKPVFVMGWKRTRT